MGEHVYPIQDYDGNWTEIRFSESDDDYGCLCIFPYQNEGLDIEDIRGLALFGAAVRLAFSGDLEHGFLPKAVPEWIRDEIDRVMGYKDETALS